MHDLCWSVVKKQLKHPYLEILFVIGTFSVFSSAAQPPHQM